MVRLALLLLKAIFLLNLGLQKEAFGLIFGLHYDAWVFVAIVILNWCARCC